MMVIKTILIPAEMIVHSLYAGMTSLIQEKNVNLMANAQLQSVIS